NAAAKFPPPEAFRRRAYVKSLVEYQARYRDSVKDPEGFWAEVAKRIDWIRPPQQTLKWDFERPDIKWYLGGKLNVSANCLDRHVAAGRENQVALIWEGNEPGEMTRYTYGDLLREVSRFANVLKSLGVRKGDRVCIYLPMVVELPIAMLACARIGAVHSVVFGGFSAEAIRSRILDSFCSILITADEGRRGAKPVPLKATSDATVEGVGCIRHLVVVRRTGTAVTMRPGRDLWWHELMARPDIAAECPPEAMDAEDPLFILYT